MMMRWKIEESRVDEPPRLRTVERDLPRHASITLHAWFRYTTFCVLCCAWSTISRRTARPRLVANSPAAERCCYGNALYIGAALHKVGNLIMHADQQPPQHCPAHLIAEVGPGQKVGHTNKTSLMVAAGSSSIGTSSRSRNLTASKERRPGASWREYPRKNRQDEESDQIRCGINNQAFVSWPVLSPSCLLWTSQVLFIHHFISFLRQS